MVVAPPLAAIRARGAGFDAFDDFLAVGMLE